MRVPTIRRSVLAALIMLVTIAALAAGSLVSLIGVLHRTTETLTAAVESVRIAKDAQRDLLLHARAQEPMARSEKASDLRRRLADASTFITSPDEQETLARAHREVAAYLQSPAGAEQSKLEPAAFEALVDLVQVNLAQADEARARASRLDALADVVGVIMVTAVLGGAVALGVWFRAYVLGPLFGLSGAIRAFGLGKESMRAPEDGPEELREIARQFNAMTERMAEQRTAHRTHMAAVAHDLRNPLGTLRLAVDALSADPAPDRARIERVVSIVRRQTARLARLADDLLDTTNLSAGRLELRLGLHDLRDVVRSTVELFASSSKKHEVEVQMPSAPVYLTCDPQRIEQVLYNLVGNAIKYSPKGGVVGVHVEPKRDTVEISVTDQGVGMTAEEIVDSFQPYSRAETLRDSVPGHGLGLFIARRIVDDHGGVMSVESTPGRGSTFRIALPCEPQLTAALEAIH